MAKQSNLNVMQYKEIRRKDRIWNSEESDELLSNAEYGFLAFADENSGYGIPISYAREENKLYFHCAPEGRKLEALKNCANVSFAVVGKTRVRPNEFTTSYQSVIAQGKISQVFEEEEKRKALRLLLKKYSKGFEDIGEKYIDSSIGRTAVLRLDIEFVSAKTKGEKKMQK